MGNRRPPARAILGGLVGDRRHSGGRRRAGNPGAPGLASPEAVALTAFPTHAPCARPAMAWLPVGIGAALFNAAPIPTLCVAGLLRPAGVRPIF